MLSPMSKIELLANEATKLPSFPINLENIRNSVYHILSTFGKNGIFAEYTVHDFDHVADMLRTAEWVIPKSTWDNLTSADWLMVVLSFYFHDLGLIVTNEEFENRERSGFKEYCERNLFSGEDGEDYRFKVDRLEEHARERFLYQEYVRGTHARRVRAWIEGKPADELGYSKIQIAEIDKLLTGLDRDFRRDLGVICESHNLDDIEDVKKYVLSRPYGNTAEEVCNLQYSAILLRIVDLLQITRHRAPSVLYRVINPADPISQVEWAKQNAVRTVRRKVPKDADGNADTLAQSDTIEVHATFNEEGGFFGLTSYLRYAKSEIAKCYAIASKSANQTERHYDFPWRHIDDSFVQAEGFIQRPFGFVLDQGKILDLLTGHTLYNDSNVVLRELCQNAIDAVRLQYDDGSVELGTISVSWNSSLSELIVSDNGTGMTQDVVENHLLKVGSSRYQEQKFKDQFPDFSPISRFGIGVLSAFMVADEVEIITVSEEEEQARQISLRSVHGKYLIRLLDKSSEEVRRIGSHGTTFRLKFRPSAEAINVVDVLSSWVLFPRCVIKACVDGGDEVQIGYGSPKEALERYLSTAGITHIYGDDEWRVEEREIEGFTLAYAQKYNRHYREWGLLTTSDRLSPNDPRKSRAPVASCVEGIAVEFGTPGYEHVGLLAVANSVGHRAPRTNVARSAIEGSSDKEELAQNAYTLFLQAIVEEQERLVVEEGYSLTWSHNQVPFLMYPIFGEGPTRISQIGVFEKCLEDVPLLLLEDVSGRRSVSIREMQDVGGFWTVESSLMNSIEQFVKESKLEITAKTLIGAGVGAAYKLPDGPILSNFGKYEKHLDRVWSLFEPAVVDVKAKDRQLNLKWEPGTGRWISKRALRDIVYDLGEYQFVSEVSRATERGRNFDLYIPSSDVNFKGIGDYVAVKAYHSIFVRPDSPISMLFHGIEFEDMDANTIKRLYIMSEALIASSDGDSFSVAAAERYFRSVVDYIDDEIETVENVVMDCLVSLEENNLIFNPLAWGQRSNSRPDDIYF